VRDTRMSKHQLTADEQYKGQIASRTRAGLKGRMRQEGMFIDAAAFIMKWRVEDGSGHPPIARLVEFLSDRGWTGEQGGELSRTEVSRMLAAMDPKGDALPAHKADWDDAMRKGVILPDTEITAVSIEPEAWLEFRKAKIDGWKPTWRDQALSGEDADMQAERLKNLLTEARAKLHRPDR